MNVNNKPKAQLAPEFNVLVNAMLAELHEHQSPERLAQFLEASVRGIAIALTFVDSRSDMGDVAAGVCDSIKEQASKYFEKSRADRGLILQINGNSLVLPANG